MANSGLSNGHHKLASTTGLGGPGGLGGTVGLGPLDLPPPSAAKKTLPKQPQDALTRRV
jgi:hypothetical protein